MSAEGSFEFVDSVTSDLTFVARGPTLEAIFRAAGEAVAAATIEDLASLEERTTCSVRLRDTELDMLLLRFINELIFLRDAEGLLLLPRRVHIERDGEIELLDVYSFVLLNAGAIDTSSLETRARRSSYGA